MAASAPPSRTGRSRSGACCSTTMPCGFIACEKGERRGREAVRQGDGAAPRRDGHGVCGPRAHREPGRHRQADPGFHHRARLGRGVGRDGLSRKTRSMLNLAMLAILNRQHELRGHVRGAVNNGVTREEIREIFLHVGLYAGAPIMLDSARIAKEVLAEMEKST